MSIFRDVVFVAALAGLFAGYRDDRCMFATVPLILQAEVYERPTGAGMTTPPPPSRHTAAETARACA